MDGQVSNSHYFIGYRGGARYIALGIDNFTPRRQRIGDLIAGTVVQIYYK